jgi:2-polyprenyl-6-methoxyphenol hydroxylase-like FAD-dependent oxidoreductase
MALLNWGDLWSQLRKRVPDAVYVEGRHITGIAAEDDRLTVSTDDGWKDSFELVLCGDGYNSLGRRTLFPDMDIAYRGYVLWRGVLDEARLSDSGPLETALYRLHYKGLPGNAVFYFVPGPSGSVETGNRWVNWACYVPIFEEDLFDFLVDREGLRHRHSLPPGRMRHSEEARLKALMAQHLPSYFSEIVIASDNTFAQPIYSMTVPAYARGRLALLGDAGSIAPPFTGSGVFKAVMNAIDLTAALKEIEDVPAALSRWSEEQTGRGARLAALGEQMEDAFVWSAPDFSLMDEDETRSWWKGAVQFPDEFSYLGK